MRDIKYKHFYTTGSDLSEAYTSMSALIEEGWLCASCRRPKPHTMKINIRIDTLKPVNSPYCTVAGYGVALAKKEFLFLFGDKNVSRDLHLGDLYGSSGERLEDWATVRGRHQVVVRGSRNASFRCCEECGNILYSASPGNYLFPAPDPGIAILQSDLSGLVVREDLVRGKTINRRRGFGIETLPVLKNPRDGLATIEC